MSGDEVFQYAAMAVAGLCELYAIRGGNFSALAWLWDIIARITGHVANFLGHVSVSARLNYFTVVNDYG